MNSKTKSSALSLRWAINELNKQKEDLGKKLKSAQKKEETESLIAEVLAQKEALTQRISSLQDGLNNSAELVDEPVYLIDEELNKVDDKLEIAQDRLKSLEQEEYLEELGRKLNGDFSSEDSNDKNPSDIPDTPTELSDQNGDQVSVTEFEVAETESSLQSLPSPTPVLMKAPANRIETEEEIVEERASRVTNSENISKESKLEQCSPASIQNLEECANALGIEPDFLLNKGLQAVLRMIARNGNKISFPLEVEQVENS
jgi:hypothetical protein